MEVVISRTIDTKRPFIVLSRYLPITDEYDYYWKYELENIPSNFDTFEKVWVQISAENVVVLMNDYKKLFGNRDIYIDRNFFLLTKKYLKPYSIRVFNERLGLKSESNEMNKQLILP